MFPDCFHSLDVFVAFGRPVASERIARHQDAVFVFNRQDGSAGDVRRSVVVSSHDEDKRERERRREVSISKRFSSYYSSSSSSLAWSSAFRPFPRSAGASHYCEISFLHPNRREESACFVCKREREREYNHATKSNAAQNVFVAKTMTR